MSEASIKLIVEAVVILAVLYFIYRILRDL